MIIASNYKVKASSFRGNSKYGRTTQLIDKSTGKVAVELMGACSKSDLIRRLEWIKEESLSYNHLNY